VYLSADQLLIIVNKCVQHLTFSSQLTDSVAKLKCFNLHCNKLVKIRQVMM